MERGVCLYSHRCVVVTDVHYVSVVITTFFCQPVATEEGSTKQPPVNLHKYSPLRHRHNPTVLQIHHHTLCPPPHHPLVPFSTPPRTEKPNPALPHITPHDPAPRPLPTPPTTLSLPPTGSLPSYLTLRLAAACAIDIAAKSIGTADVPTATV